MAEKAKIDTGVEGDCTSTTDGVDPNTGFTPLGEHDPFDNIAAHVDGDADDYEMVKPGVMPEPFEPKPYLKDTVRLPWNREDDQDDDA